VSERRFRVEVAEVAARDLEEIAAYIAVDSPTNAGTVLDRLLRRIESLEVAPLRGAVIAELAQLGIRTWRELPARPYRIFYRVFGRRVIVVAVLDGRRDLADVLLDRLVREP